MYCTPFYRTPLYSTLFYSPLLYYRPSWACPRASEPLLALLFPCRNSFQLRRKMINEARFYQPVFTNRKCDWELRINKSFVMEFIIYICVAKFVCTYVHIHFGAHRVTAHLYMHNHLYLCSCMHDITSFYLESCCLCCAYVLNAVS